MSRSGAENAAGVSDWRTKRGREDFGYRDGPQNKKKLRWEFIKEKKKENTPTIKKNKKTRSD